MKKDKSHSKKRYVTPRLVSLSPDDPRVVQALKELETRGPKTPPL